MAITILTSIQDDFRYYNNLGYLRREREEGHIQFQGGVHSHEPAINFPTARVYDFTRSATARIREDMTDFLNGADVLPGLANEDLRRIREAFGPLFNYYAYKDYLNQVGQQRPESMKMLIFNEAHGYVAHVCFNCTSHKIGEGQFRVEVALTCQRFTFFQLQEMEFEAFLQALQNLHVAEGQK